MDRIPAECVGLDQAIACLPRTKKSSTSFLCIRPGINSADCTMQIAVHQPSRIRAAHPSSPPLNVVSIHDYKTQYRGHHTALVTTEIAHIERSELISVALLTESLDDSLNRVYIDRTAVYT